MWRKFADVLLWLGLSVYFGGIVALGPVVAGAVFATARDNNVGLTMKGIAVPPLEMHRQVGGEIFGAILNRFVVVEMIALILILIGLAGAILGHRIVRRGTWVSLIIWFILLLVLAYDAGIVRPRVWQVRQALRDTAPAHITPGIPWPEQVEFDALHARSETLGNIKAWGLLSIILVTAWRGLAGKRFSSAGEPRRFGSERRS